MRRSSCSACRTSLPIGSMFTVNGELFCEPCADGKVAELRQAGAPLQVARGDDPTLCARCSSDFGSQELPVLAGLHVCETCRRTLLNFEYPKWLKGAAVALLALLAVSLFHGRSYFVAGRAYYKAKKLLDSGSAQDSVPYFEQALSVPSNSPEIAGNAALAYLRSGRPDLAYTTVEGRSFEDDAFYRSVKTEFQSWNIAAAKADEAAKLYDESRLTEAAQRMHEAAAAYPAFSSFGMQAGMLDSAVAFEAKDYDRMMKVSESLWTKYPGYDTAATLAGAYACVYASGGDASIRRNAMDMMTRAKALASSKEQRDDLQEFEPRFNHRIETRQILTREQYDAMFRPQVSSRGW